MLLFFATIWYTDIEIPLIFFNPLNFNPGLISLWHRVSNYYRYSKVWNSKPLKYHVSESLTFDPSNWDCVEDFWFSWIPDSHSILFTLGHYTFWDSVSDSTFVFSDSSVLFIKGPTVDEHKEKRLSCHEEGRQFIPNLIQVKAKYIYDFILCLWRAHVYLLGTELFVLNFIHMYL